MDRDNRWQRVERRRTGLHRSCRGPKFKSAEEGDSHYYGATPTKPKMIGDESQRPRSSRKPMATRPAQSSRTADHRGRSATNTAANATREDDQSFGHAEFAGFDRGPKLDLTSTTMTAYEQGMHSERRLPPSRRSCSTRSERCLRR